MIGLFREDVTKAMDELNIGAKTGEEGDKEMASGGRKKGQKGKKRDDEDWLVNVVEVYGYMSYYTGRRWVM